jgi:hypothetical protein
MADEGAGKKNGTKLFWIQHILIDKVRPKNPFWHPDPAGAKCWT